MWKVSAAVSPVEVERAKRALIATPDRRGPEREALDGIADIRCEGLRAKGVIIDLGEGGLSLLCSIEPEVGSLLYIELSGLVIEGRVRHASRAGDVFRIGVEAAYG